jgi:hypothetical protein
LPTLTRVCTAIQSNLELDWGVIWATSFNYTEGLCSVDNRTFGGL